MDKVIPSRMEMICGSYEAEVRKYIPFVVTEGDRAGMLWLVADQPNMGDNVVKPDKEE